MRVWEKHLENSRGIGSRGIIYGSNTLTNSLTIFIEPNENFQILLGLSYFQIFCNYCC